MYMYEVAAKCGHVGRNHYVEKVFAVSANSGSEAAEIVRYLPRVKHDQKDAIIYVEKIGEERYLSIWEDHENDPYFQCKNIQEQRRTCQLEIFDEETEDRDFYREDLSQAKYLGKKKLRNPKKYINRYSERREYRYEAM